MKTKYMTFVYATSIWDNCKNPNDLYSSIKEWLTVNVGKMGDSRIEHHVWPNDCTWSPSLTECKSWTKIPCGFYFINREDATVFKLRFGV